MVLGAGSGCARAGAAEAVAEGATGCLALPLPQLCCEAVSRAIAGGALLAALRSGAGSGGAVAVECVGAQ